MINEELFKIKFEIENQEKILNNLNKKLDITKKQLIIDLVQKCKFTIDKNICVQHSVHLIPIDKSIFEKIGEIYDWHNKKYEWSYSLEEYSNEDGYICEIRFSSPDQYWIEINYPCNSEKFKLIVEKYKFEFDWNSLKESLIEDKNDLLNQIKEIDKMLENFKC